MRGVLPLSRFKTAFKYFPTGEISFGNAGREPDFFVTTDTTILGIELTRLDRTADNGKRPLQEGESIREQIVEEARVIYDSNGWPPLDVCVMFSSNEDCQKRKSRFLRLELHDLFFDIL